MENITYNIKDIEIVLNLINQIPFQGIDNAMKINNIFQILNSPFLKQQEQNLNINNNEHKEESKTMK